MQSVLEGRAPSSRPVLVSIGVLAWNEADVIRKTLDSILRQSIFAELSRRGQRCELVCIANGCTDATPQIAAEVLGAAAREHPAREALVARALDLPERGKLNAWNVFVHERSAPEAELLVLLDGDIVLHGEGTLWRLCQALLDHPEASISTDEPIKDIALKPRKSIFDRISLATSAMARGGAQVSGQLYCIRAAVARNIWLPRGLPACEDGFIKALVCTGFLSHETDTRRVIRAPGAAHVFASYATVLDVLRNQKRQMIGQTALHVLDGHLRRLSPAERERMAETLREMDRADPLWLKRLIGAHVRGTRHFWELFPNLLGYRFQRLMKVPGPKKVAYAPAALAGFLVTLVSSAMAYRFLVRGNTDYWPDTTSPDLNSITAEGGALGA
ncbi:glycosyltransferase family 2 protein [Sorangium sp. So ce1335]|uniref:glycosyltransferase family 2 protein n=1 Tax=Sorangium sp. So ce1335 TaxID=3133335 RepID=UPI003F62A231